MKTKSNFQPLKPLCDMLLAHDTQTEDSLKARPKDPLSATPPPQEIGRAPSPPRPPTSDKKIFHRPNKLNPLYRAKGVGGGGGAKYKSAERAFPCCLREPQDREGVNG